MRLFRSVKSRIYGAFAAITLVLVITGASAIMLMSNAEHLFGDYRKIARQSLVLDEFLRDISLLRIDFLNYLLTPTEQWAGAVREQISVLAAAKQTAPTYFSQDAAAMASVDEASTLLTQYAAGFDTLTAAVALGADPQTHSQTAVLTAKGPQMFNLFYDLLRANRDPNILCAERTKCVIRQKLISPAVSAFDLLRIER